MKNHKKIGYLVLTLIISLCLTSCSLLKKEEKPEHTFDEAWSSDSQKHWHKCTDSGCEVIDSIAAHTSSDWITKVEPTNDNPGYKVKECTVCGYEIERVTLLPLNHHYGDPTYTWNAANTICTATVSCIDDGCTNTITQNGTVTSTVKTEATCLTNEVRTYSATFTNTLFLKQTKEAEKANSKTAHVYGTPSYVFSSNNQTCTATVTCTTPNCGHQETETVNTTCQQLSLSTCISKEKNKYTATFTNSLFTSQSKEAEIGELGNHFYGNKIEAKAATLFENGNEAYYYCGICQTYFTGDENKTETTLNAVTIPMTSLSYTQVHELTNEDKNNVTVIGVVIGYSYDGTTSNKTRHGLIIMDTFTNDIVLVNGMNVTIGEYKSYTGTNIKINDVVLVKGNFKAHHNISGTNQYYESIEVNEYTGSTSTSPIYDIEILSNNYEIDFDSLTFESATNYSELNTKLNVNTENQSYKIIKLIGTEDNPVSFSLINNGNVSAKNMGVFFGEYNVDTIKFGSKNLALSPYSLSLTVDIERTNLYNSFYNFEADSQEAGTTINGYGEMYIAVTQLTQSNVIISLVFNDLKTLRFDTSKIKFQQYLLELSESNATSNTYTFDGGVGMNDITNYIPSIDYNDPWAHDFEIQNGSLVYIGSDYRTVAESLGITCNESQDLKLKALLNTAYAYYYQGNQIQYDMKNNRRIINVNPEAASSYTVYLDCSSFVNSVFYNTFNKNILAGRTGSETPSTLNFYSTSQQDNASSNYGLIYSVQCDKVSDTTELINQIKASLQPGDIINYRHGTSSTSDKYRGNAGHVMLYIGNNEFIHCTGSSYTPASGTDPLSIKDFATTDEKAGGAIKIDNWDVLFETDGERYLFNSSKCISFQVYRVLNRTYSNNSKVFNSISNQAKYRLSIPNVSIEKTATVKQFNTVTNGSTISFTIELVNNNSFSVPYINVVENIDPNFSFVQATREGTYNSESNKVTWENICLEPGDRWTLTYYVTVNGTDLENGYQFISNGTVNGVNLNTYTLYYSNNKISVDDVNSFISSNKTTTVTDPLKHVNTLYSSNIFTNIHDNVLYYLLQNDYLDVNTDSDYYKYLIPTFYNGTYYDDSITDFDTFERIRLVKSEYLEAGDIIVFKYHDGSQYVTRSFIYTEEMVGGENTGIIYELLTTGIQKVTTKDSLSPVNGYATATNDTSQFLSRMSGAYQYAIFRPSLANLS